MLKFNFQRNGIERWLGLEGVITALKRINTFLLGVSSHFGGLDWLL